MASLVDRIAVIGLGLIGSSLARALKLHGVAKEIVGCDRSVSIRDYACKSGFVHRATDQVAEAAKDADIIILAVPPSAIEPVAKAIATVIKTGAIVTDTASVKRLALQQMKALLPAGSIIVPAHPIAGSEKSGPEAGDGRLFDGKRVILTPEKASEEDAVFTVIKLWQAVGAQVEMMPSDVHDLVYAYVSHLPQLLAFAAMEPLAAMRPKLDAPATFHRFIRLGGSNPMLWTDIFLANTDYLLQALDRFLSILHHIHSELATGASEQPSAENAQRVATALFPRLVASCVIIAINVLEKESGLTLVRYAGSGLSDFSAPAAMAPESDIEAIAHHHKQVGILLQQFIQQLAQWKGLISTGNSKAIQAALTQANKSFQMILHGY